VGRAGPAASNCCMHLPPLTSLLFTRRLAEFFFEVARRAQARPDFRLLFGDGENRAP